MTFARRVFLDAGVSGLIVLLPPSFMEGSIAAENPPPLTQPEYFYGFIGVGLAWQILFLLVARDPSRSRFVMVPATLEKLAFGGAALILYAQRRLALQAVACGLIDLVFAALFLVAFMMTQQRTGEAVTAALA
jgi:hypothetical protein